DGDFLLRFAKRCGDKRSIGTVHGPAGKGDLSGVFAQMNSPLGQQQPRLGAANHRDQYGGLTLI
ncbi:hypothetical protein LTSEALA_1950, partial [Salmonella enterica subsp. enterica serovar Alachua str. R6-377]